MEADVYFLTCDMSSFDASDQGNSNTQFNLDTEI